MGTTAEIRDLAAVNKSDFLRIAVLTCVVVLAVLIVLLRRLLVSLFLVLTVLWGYLVTMGVTKLVFMGLFGAAFDGVTWRLPLFLFVILVAVGEDYNIYLMSRVVEEQQRRGTLGGVAGAHWSAREASSPVAASSWPAPSPRCSSARSAKCTSWDSHWPSACCWTRSSSARSSSPASWRFGPGGFRGRRIHDLEATDPCAVEEDGPGPQVPVPTLF